MMLGSQNGVKRKLVS